MKARIVSHEMRVYEYHWMCDDCDGEMMYSGVRIGWSDVKESYLHKCNKCGTKKEYPGEYFPSTKHVRMN